MSVLTWQHITGHFWNGFLFWIWSHLKGFDQIAFTCAWTSCAWVTFWRDYSFIFTLANNFLRWTCFGPTRFIHPWTTLIHAIHVILMAVERNNQTHLIYSFFFAAYLQDLKQNSTNNEQKRCKKQSVNIRDEFHFSEVNGSMNATGPVQS